MSAALVRIADTSNQGNLGIIWSNSATPVTVDSSVASAEVLLMDQAQMPNSVDFPNPWYLKWRLSDVEESTSDHYTNTNINANRTMEMRLQTSADATTWTDYDQWDITMLNGMTGRTKYNIDVAFIPKYVRVTGKIWPDSDGTNTQASILMGMENMVL